MKNICELFWRYTSEYAPYTKDSLFYPDILARIVDVENWEFRKNIERSDFEKLLLNNYQLEITYVDLYSKSAAFVLLELEISDKKYDFYCMVDKKEIVLIFYKNSE